MGFAKIFVWAVAAIVISASFVFADVSVDVDNSNSNTATATGGNANQNQSQQQQQQQQQNQTAVGYGGEGGQANNSLTIEDKREHINALPGVVGAFVGAPASIADKGWEQIKCDPAYKKFKMEELRNMVDSGRFLDKRGSIFDAMTDVKIKSVVRVRFGGQYDTKSISILNQIPTNVPVLGTFEGAGDYGWPLDEVIGKTLLEAKILTNAVNVVVWKAVEIDAKNSGLSLGLGAAGATSSADTAGAGSIGGITGNSYSQKRYFWKVRVYAYGDVPPEPDICTATTSVRTGSVIAQCNPEPIRKEIAIFRNKISQCKNWGINNLNLRFQKANALADLAKCTGENGYYSEAINNYKLAEKNYLKGKDIKANKAEADQVIYKVYWNWSAVTREQEGRDAEVRFAQSKKMTMMPSGVQEMKR